tara:strand:+ start:461 stop:571 length:111 start_codon:yes stop_codon:yes gene_type:complete
LAAAIVALLVFVLVQLGMPEELAQGLAEQAAEAVTE